MVLISTISLFYTNEICISVPYKPFLLSDKEHSRVKFQILMHFHTFLGGICEDNGSDVPLTSAVCTLCKHEIGTPIQSSGVEA